MASYIDIHGNNIPIVSSDPSNPITGEIWYNTTAGSLKGHLYLAAAWSTSGTVPQIVRGGGSGGTQTAAWLAGGLQYPGDTKNKTWTYNGSSWTAGNNIPANYFIGGSTGPDAAGLLFDGIGSYGPGTATYEWDGTNWTSGGAIPAIGPGGNSFTSGAGTQTAAFAIGGIGDPPPARVDRVLDYNGASWTSGESTPLTTAGTASDGPTTATWIGGGDGGPGMSGKSFEYNGASWTASGDIGTALPQGLSAQGWGPQTAAIIGGGTSSAPTATVAQIYDGTSWSTTASMTVKRQNNAYSSQSAGTQTGWIAGGYESSGNTDATEEYQSAGPGTVSITAS
jgi:hypothetical protein